MYTIIYRAYLNSMNSIKSFCPCLKINQNTSMTGVRLALSMARHLIVYGLVDASVMQIVIQKKVFALMKEYNISSRLTFSNSLIEEKHLSDIKCNELCRLLNLDLNNGIIIHSDVLMKYLKSKYPNLYFVSSTTKVLTDFNDFKQEVENPDFAYVVPDFRLNKQLEKLNSLSESYKPKVEFLCNECCWYGCKDRKECYKSVSRQNLGIDCMDHVCKAPFSKEGYRFSRVMENPAFISLEDILNIYVPMGYSNFKIEGRDLGSALLLEFILYYMVKPQYQIHVREAMYLDAMLDLF